MKLRLERITDVDDPALLPVSVFFKKCFPRTGYDLNIFKKFLEKSRRKKYEHSDWFMLYLYDSEKENSDHVLGLLYAFAIIKKPDVNFVMTYYIATNPDSRGKGLGKYLFLEAQKQYFDPQARKAGFEGISGYFGEIEKEKDENDADFDARIEFFRRLGYKKIDLDYVFPDIGNNFDTCSDYSLIFLPTDKIIQKEFIDNTTLINFLQEYFRAGYSQNKPTETKELIHIKEQMTRWVRLLPLEDKI
ncbi:GNAT family N-acetyltransferase [Candidatus Woesearchaeota archaeon]|nr:GNAT family N-acetyltransferase [Candidatus Woesearchaeota archaeon]